MNSATFVPASPPPGSPPSTASTVLAWTFPAASALASLVGGEDDPIAAFKNLAGEAADAAFGVVVEAVDFVTGRTTANKNAILTIGSKLALANKVEGATGFPLSYLMMPVQYYYQYANPVYIPGQPELDQLHITGRISLDAWTCYTKANGNLPDLARPVMDMKQRRPDVSEIITLYRRGKFKGGLTECLTRLADVGVMDPMRAAEYIDLFDWQPQPPDLLRFMVRDVFDPEAVKKYGLDAEFEKKYTAEATKLGEAVGLSNETAKLEWMSHWRVPSDTALYTMVQRLPPDRPEVMEWDRRSALAPTPAERAALGPRPATFTVADLQYALTINDNLPSFVDALTAIQYDPITTSDAVRMFEQGFIDKPELKWRIQFTGKKPADAETLANFFESQRARKLANGTGVWTTRKTIKAYKQGVIPRATADSLLAPILLDAQVRRDTLDKAELELEAETKAATLKQWKRHYLLGEFDTDELRDKLRGLNILEPGLSATVSQWESERLGRAKEPRVAMLCKWYTAGFITSDSYFSRLQRIGYTVGDAQRIIDTCGLEESVRRSRAALAAAEKARAEARRNQQEYKQDLKAQLAELEKRIKERQQQLDQMLNA